MMTTTRRPVNPSARRCAFTGYRPAKMPFGYDENCPLALDFKKQLYNTIEMLIQLGYGHFISGGAMGMDIMAAEMVLELRKTHPEITLEMAIPFEGQAGRWDAAYRARWQRCVDEADVVTILSHEYIKGCMFARNRYMVEQAELLVAGYDGKEGGTKMTVEMAKRMRKRVCVVRPVVEKKVA